MGGEHYFEEMVINAYIGDWNLPQGGSPVSISMIVHPKLHISEYLPVS